MDASDLKQFFEINYSQIYFIFYENFIALENSLKLKGKHVFTPPPSNLLFKHCDLVLLIIEFYSYNVLTHYQSVNTFLEWSNPIPLADCSVVLFLGSVTIVQLLFPFTST